MANSCVFPEDIMLSCILSRLPVKSILRFKSVCKAWLHLLSTPEFLKLHRAHFSSDPRNQSVILYGNIHRSTTRVLNNINSVGQSKQAAMRVEHPYGHNSHDVHIVGCCNGLVCMVRPDERELGFVLWNPATRLSKFVPLSKLDFTKLSLGFGYDAEGDDLKVVKIVRDRFNTSTSVVEVYSVRSDSWTTIKLDFRFAVVLIKCNFIVNGNPYWLAHVNAIWSDFAMVYFDATKLVFKTVHVPSFLLSLHVACEFVDLNGSLGALLPKRFIDDIGTAHLSLEVWVFDESWRKSHSLGPVEGNVNRVLQCLGNGNIVGDCDGGELFVFNPQNGCFNKIVVDEAQKFSFEQVYGYTESLTQIH